MNFNKRPKKKGYKPRPRPKYTWGPKKDFQTTFFQYLMTNNDVGLSEIIQEIFCYMDFESLLHCRLVCKTWYGFLINCRSLWSKSLNEAREKYLYQPQDYMSR